MKSGNHRIFTIFPKGRENKKVRIRIYASLACLLISITCFGQEYRFRNYNVEDGLAQSQVRSILQDSRGYLWIGTLGGGVSRYNGLSFANLTVKAGLCDNNIITILEDRQGNLWFGTYRGVSKFDGNTFTTLKMDEGPENLDVTALLEDGGGNLWIGTRGSGVIRFDGQTFTYFTEKEGLKSTIISSLLEDRSGNIWIGTEGGGAVRYDGRTFTPFTENEGLKSNIVTSLLEDRGGSIWMGTENNGVARYDGRTFTHFTENEGLKKIIISSLLEDRSGNIWIGSEGSGIARYDGRTFTFFTEQDGLSSNTVWSLAEDREGNIWIGTYRGGLDRCWKSPFAQITAADGLSNDIVRSIIEDNKGNLWFGTYKGGVCRYDGKTYTRFSAKDGLANNFVLSILEDRKGNLWFGTYRGVSRYDGTRFEIFAEKEGLGGSTIRSIAEDKQGNLWFGSNREGVSKYDGRTFTRLTTGEGLNADEVMALFVDGKGNIWIGTSNGINLYDGKNLVNFSKKMGLGENEVIYVIVEDTQGNIWFGSYGQGIIRYTHPEINTAVDNEPEDHRGSRVKFSTNEGMFSDDVVSMIFDDQGNLWIGTEKGVDKFFAGRYEDTGEITFKHFGPEEGFSGIECIHNSIAKDKLGNLWFGTLRGAIRYSPEDDLPNVTEPKTHIVALRLFFETVDWAHYSERIKTASGLPVGLRLPYRQNHVTFDFIGISLSAPEKVRYQYELEGFDKAWSPVAEETSATFSNLPPGQFVFNLKACNNDGVWNEEPETFRFEIASPYWMKWWFYVLSAILVLSGIRIYIKIRIKNLERINLELEKLTLVASKTKNAVIILNTGGVFEWVNQGFTEMTGYTLEELQRTGKNSLKELDSNLSTSDFSSVNRGPAMSIATESQFHSKNGKELWISFNLTPIHGRSGNLKKIVAIGVEITESRRLDEERKQNFARLKKTIESTVSAMAKLVEVKDPSTANHQRETADLAVAIAEEMGLAKDRIYGLRLAALIHDVGKIYVPTEILVKPAKLSEPEFEMVKNHPQFGHDILKDIEFSWPVALSILQHHERLDGSGYPQGLKGEEILLEARILAVSDVVTAMSAHRPFRPALNWESVSEEIKKNRNTLYDPDVVDVCLKVFQKGVFKSFGSSDS